MIDNPLPDQVMEEKETLQKLSDFEDYCKNHAVEIATHYKVHKDYVQEFLDYSKVKSDEISDNNKPSQEDSNA